MVTFAVEAQIPDSWDCPRCGLPASLDSENPPPAPKIEPYKTHLAYVKERRSDAEAAGHPRRGDPAAPHAAASPATSSSELVRQIMRLPAGATCAAAFLHFGHGDLPWRDVHSSTG